MIALVAMLLCAQADEDKIGAAVWYAKQAKEQSDKINEKLERLVVESADTRAQIVIMTEKIRDIDAERERIVSSLFEWILGIAGGTAGAMGILFRAWAKFDHSRGKG